MNGRRPLPMATAAAGQVELTGCCECRACVFSVALPDVAHVKIVDCHCSLCRKHSAAAFVTWMQACPGAVTWGVGASKPARFEAQCAGYLCPVKKLVCPQCYSVLAMEPADGTTVEVSLSCVDDGCYTDLKAGRKADDDKWPPNLRLHRTARCTSRVSWYPMQVRAGGAEMPHAKPPLAGGCLCGANTFELTSGMLSEIQHCYCTQCRKTSGAPFVTWTPVNERDFKWTSESADSLILQHMSKEAIRGTCGKCGSTLRMVYPGSENPWQLPGSRGEGQGTVWAAVGALDYDTLLAKEEHSEAMQCRVVHICVKSKAPWVLLPDDGATRLDYTFD